MARGFIKGDRQQMLLLPPSVDDWVSADHPVRFVQTCLEQMDLRCFYEHYAHEGRPPYDPQTMLGILIYAYSKGMRSSRKISKACEDEVPFRWISGNIAPDHRTICRFRSKHEKDFTTFFNETLRLCAEAGLLRLGQIFLDGTKVKANAALSANHHIDHITKISEEAEAVDKEEDEQFGESERGDRLPKELVDPKERLKWIKEAKARLDRELKQKQEDQAQKVKEHKEKGPPRGRIPKNISTRDRMDRGLLTKRGYNIYRKKSYTIEPVFGQLKEA
jgi:transposase